MYTPGASAYIEDLYQLNGDAADISPQTKVQEKFDAITTHLNNANGISNTTQVFITFASGFGNGVDDILSPRVNYFQMFGYGLNIDDFILPGPCGR